MAKQGGLDSSIEGWGGMGNPSSTGSSTGRRPSRSLRGSLVGCISVRKLESPELGAVRKPGPLTYDSIDAVRDPEQHEAPIFLIGFMTAGKSTVGRMLAAGLGWDFRDVDQVIVAEAGMSVSQIFATEGEAGFRQREAQAVRDAARAVRTVVATGGGAACVEGNLTLMLEAARVVVLDVDPAEVVRRAGRSRRWRARSTRGAPSTPRATSAGRSRR